MSGPVNIDSRGYGKIYKAIMRNPNLPVLAKAIYCYFAAFAGNGVKAFPKRDRIVRDLNINKDTYTKHLKTLVAEGYIGKERTSGGNVYTIMQTVPSYSTPPRTADKDMTDMLVLENVKAKGFGTVPKLVMLDTRLSAQAKAVYCYFAAFAGAGTTAFPRRSTITRELKLSVNAYYTHLKQLTDHGYLSIEQQKRGGRFDVSIYRLADMVDTPPLPRPGKGERKAVSEKQGHGEAVGESPQPPACGELDPAMSGKQGHGGKLPADTGAMSGKAMSEKKVSGRTASQYFGHANTRNISTRNSYWITEQGGYNPQRRPRFPADDNIATVPAFSLEDANAALNRAFLQSEAEGWGSLQVTIGNMLPDDRERYLQAVCRILEELARQVLNRLNRAEQPEQVKAALRSEAFARMFDEILLRWDEIRCMERYAAAALENLLG